MLLSGEYFEHWYDFLKKIMHYKYRVDWHYVPDLLWNIFGRGAVDGWWLGLKAREIIRRDEPMYAVKSIQNIRWWLDGWQKNIP